MHECWGGVRQRLVEFCSSRESDVVFGLLRGDSHPDHRIRYHLISGYEISRWGSDLPNPTVHQPNPARDGHA
jgi:hypothetical protein